MTRKILYVIAGFGIGVVIGVVVSPNGDMWTIISALVGGGVVAALAALLANKITAAENTPSHGYFFLANRIAGTQILIAVGASIVEFGIFQIYPGFASIAQNAVFSNIFS